MVNKSLLTLLTLTALLAGGCATDGYRAASFGEPVYTPAYARGFEIRGRQGGESTMIVSLSPWQGADSASTAAIFVRRGGEDIPAGYDGPVVEEEARRIVCTSSSHVALLDAVGAADRVVGVSGLGYIVNPTVRQRADSIVDIGYDAAVDYERLVAVRPDLVLLYGIEGASPLEPRLRELGIPYLYVGEYLENSPLGKAEWMVAMAEITGRRDIGRERFMAIPPRYNALKEIASRAAGRPRVMVNTPYGDSWVMAPDSSYVARLISDAAGLYVAAGNPTNHSQAVTLEEAYLMASGADVWINTGQYDRIADITGFFPKFADVPPVVNRRVWNTTLNVTPAGGNDYWETGVVNPDLVLRDLIMIFHPELGLQAPFTYYKQLR